MPSSDPISAESTSAWPKRTTRLFWHWWLELAYGRRGITRRVNGVKLRVLPQFRSHFTKEYDATVARVLKERVRPGATCFSVGSNLGVYPLQFAAWSSPNGIVYAFEPNPTTARFLAQHVRLNGWENRIRIVEQA